MLVALLTCVNLLFTLMTCSSHQNVDFTSKRTVREKVICVTLCIKRSPLCVCVCVCVKVNFFFHCTKPANNTISAMYNSWILRDQWNSVSGTTDSLILNNSYNTWTNKDAQSTIFAGVCFVSAWHWDFCCLLTRKHYVILESTSQVWIFAEICH